MTAHARLGRGSRQERQTKVLTLTAAAEVLGKGFPVITPPRPTVFLIGKLTRIHEHHLLLSCVSESHSTEPSSSSELLGADFVDTGEIAGRIPSTAIGIPVFPVLCVAEDEKEKMMDWTWGDAVDSLSASQLLLPP